MNNSKKSPLKDRPLHVAGQSSDEKIQGYISENVSTLMIIPALLIVITIMAWVTWAFPYKYIPIVISIITLIVFVYCLNRLLLLRKEIKSLALGRTGERIVAEIFDSNRSQEFVIFHDIVAENFNIDHVILTTHGIFAVETKTFSKPPKGEITFKGEKIITGNFDTGTGIITQAESQSKWLKSMLKDSTGRDYHVMPVIVFPGWFVQPMSEDLKKRIWILNPEALSSFIKNEPLRIQESDMHLAAFHISRYIRMYN